MAGLMYDGSELPESVRKAAQFELDYKKAIGKKLPLAVEGSGIPESVRKAAQAALENNPKRIPLAYEGSKLPSSVQKAAQKALEKGVAPAAEAAPAAAGKGILGKVASAAGGPASLGLQAALYSRDADAPTRDVPPTPEEVGAANKYSQHIQELAKRAANPNQTPAMPQAPQAPAQAPKEVIEKQRQVVEATTKQQLSTSKLSRPKAAEAVVKADCERKGIDPSPQVKQKMVAEEVANMRKMDNGSLAKYISYAIMGAGVIAGSMSEENGAIWGGSFRRGYDTTVARAEADRQFKAEQAQQAQENEFKSRDLERKELDTESNVEYRGILGESSTAKVKQGDRTLDLTEARDGALNGYRNARLGQYGSGLDLQREKLALYAKRTAAQNAKDKAATDKASALDVPEMSQKDEAVKVEAYFKDRGLKSSPGATQQVAAEVRKLRQHPALAGATEDELVELAVENIQLTPEDPNWLMDLLGADPKLKAK